MTHAHLEEWYAAKLASVAAKENRACRQKWDLQDAKAYKNCGKVTDDTLDLALALKDGPRSKEDLNGATKLSETTTRDRLSHFCQRGIATNLARRGLPAVYIKGPNWQQAVERWAEQLKRELPL